MIDCHLLHPYAAVKRLLGSGQGAKTCAALGICILIAGCGGGYRPPPPGPISSSPAVGTYKVGNPYKIAGQWYTPKEDPYYDRVGIASWYGKKFNGRLTANGEVFDMNNFSAAHKTLPMPSFVKVTNLDNGRSLVVRVNDRGPFVHGRIIDLSRRAAKELGFLNQGTAKVRVEIAKNQIGESFVVAKGTASWEEQKSVIAVPAIAVESRPLAPPKGFAAALANPSVKTSALAPATLNSNRARGAVAMEPTVTSPTLLYVQAGAFSDLENAHRLRDQLSAVGTFGVAPVQIGNTRYYRVRIGPMATVERADQTLIELINSGHPNARIVVDKMNDACQVC